MPLLGRSFILAAEADDEVTLEQILQAPDNVDRNYRYAKAQAAKGNLRGAYGALERILSANPNLPQIRLLYAFVLYRLDSLDEAQRQLDLVSAQDVPAELRSEVDDLRRRIPLKQKRTIVSGRLGVGWEYDTNRNFATSSGQILFADFPLSNVAPRSDTNMVYTGNVELRHDLGLQAGHEVFGSLNYYRTEQTLLRILNLQVYSANGGMVYKSPYFHLTPSGIYDYVLLDQALYYRDHGGRLKIGHDITPKWTFYVQGQDVYQDFTPTRTVPLARDRSGIQIDATAGTDYVLGPSMKIGISYNYAAKRANNPVWAFYRNSGTLNHTWLLGRGMFLSSSLIVNDDRYPTPDPWVSVRLRRDHTWHGAVSYGLPLNLWAGFLKDLMWVYSYDYYQAVSSIPNYAYTNNKFETLLIYKWRMGL